MKIKKIMFIIGLATFSTAAIAASNTQSFHLNNQSDQTIYVWVVQAVNVTGPISGRPPYLAMIIKPHTGNVPLNYTYSDTWDDQTIFSIAFCKVGSKACFSASGEYSALSIIPASATQWKVKTGSTLSGMLFPAPALSDNVSHFEGATWNRNADFPYEVTFSNSKR